MGVQFHVKQLKGPLRPPLKIAVHPIVAVPLGLGRELLPPDQGGAGLTSLQQPGIGHLQSIGNFPNGVDGGISHPLLHLREHRLADPRQARQLAQREIAFCSHLL